MRRWIAIVSFVAALGYSTQHLLAFHHEIGHFQQKTQANPDSELLQGETADCVVCNSLHTAPDVPVLFNLHFEGSNFSLFNSFPYESFCSDATVLPSGARAPPVLT